MLIRKRENASAFVAFTPVLGLAWRASVCWALPDVSAIRSFIGWSHPREVCQQNKSRLLLSCKCLAMATNYVRRRINRSSSGELFSCWYNMTGNGYVPRVHHSDNSSVSREDEHTLTHNTLPHVLLVGRFTFSGLAAPLPGSMVNPASTSLASTCSTVLWLYYGNREYSGVFGRKTKLHLLHNHFNIMFQESV